MLTHLFDTSVYSQPLRPLPHQAVMLRWRSLGDEKAAISALCEGEVLFGIRLKGSAKLREAYDRLLRGRLEMLPDDGEVVAVFADLKTDAVKRGRPISDMDLLIAATAKAHHLIVATLNVKHFATLEGVAVEDWSTPLS